MDILAFIPTERNRDPIATAELTRAAAIKRQHDEELARMQRVMDSYAAEKLEALMTIRGYLIRWGLARVETWVANQAKEIGL